MRISPLVPGVFLACFIFGNGPVIAEDTPEDLAGQLLELNQLEQSMRESAEAMTSGFKESFSQRLKRDKPDLTDDALTELFGIMDEEIALTIDRMSAPLKSMFIAFYLDNFSKDELSALVEMHSSEVYQKQLSLMPGFMREGAKLQAQIQVEAQGRMSKSISEWLQKYE